MPRAMLPKLVLLRPRLDGQLTPGAAREHHAIHVALVLVVAMYHQEGMVYEDQPVKGGYDTHWDWLRERLAPLAAHAPTVKRIMRLLDPGAYDPAWDETAKLRANLKRLSQDVVLLARQMERERQQRAKPTPKPKH